MKTVKRILLGLLILVVLAIIGASVFLQNIKTAAIPDYNKNVEIKGLTSEVTVFRDEFGVPHLYAETEADLYYAIGFVMAQDRMW